VTPPDDVDRLRDEIEDLFDELWRVPRFSGLRRGFRPQVDCSRSEDPPELTLVAELPGVDPDGLHVVLEGRTLLLEGERRRPATAGRPSQVEIEWGPFARRIALSDDVDPDGARSLYEHGILTIVLPIREPRPAQGAVPIEVRRQS
jgi:HSP20 family protein